MQKDLPVGTPWKLLLGFSLPIMLGNTLQHLYNTADTIIVGNILGEAALSAVGICLSLTMLFTFVAMGFSSAGQVLIAQDVGAKRMDNVRHTIGTMFTFLLGISLVISVILVFKFLCTDGKDISALPSIKLPA